MNFGGVVHLNKRGFVLVLVIVLVMLFYSYKHLSRNPLAEELSLRTLLETAVLAAQNGGMEVALAQYDMQISSKGKTKEGLDDKVTNADYKSHCIMLKTLKYNFPDVLVVSEESTNQCNWSAFNEDYDASNHQIKGIDDDYVKQGDVVVWIDPLDATQEYTEQLHDYVTTMVCVSVKGKPVIGVIHKPFDAKDKTTWAWVDYGMSSNLKEIKINEKKGDKIKIITSRSHAGDVKEQLKKVYKDNLEIEIAGGAGYKALKVAKGEVDAYVHLTAIKKWDVCAGNAILNALGGNMTTKTNKPINYADLTPVIQQGLVGSLRGHKRIVEKLTSV